MRLEQFEYVVAAADHRSMSAAADECHVTAQAISKAIKQLLDAIKTLSKTHSKLNPSIFIKEGSELNQYLFPYRAELDDYDIILTGTGAKNLPACQVLAERYSIYFLREDRLGVQMNHTDALAKLDKIPLKTLTTLPLVSYITSPNTPSQLFQLTEDHGVRLIPAFTSNSPQSCANYVKNNHAYGLVTVSLLDESLDIPEELVVIPIKERIYLTHLMFIKKTKQNNADVKAFRQSFLRRFPTYRKLY